MRHPACTTATIPAPPGTLVLIAYEAGDELRVDAMPAAAIEVTTSHILGHDRAVHAVAFSGESTRRGAYAAMQLPSGAVVDHIGETFANRDDWHRQLCAWFGKRRPRQRRATKPLHLVRTAA